MSLICVLIFFYYRYFLDEIYCHRSADFSRLRESTAAAVAIAAALAAVSVESVVGPLVVV